MNQKPKNRCLTPRCRRIIPPSAVEQYKHYCRRCEWRRLKARDPVRYAYVLLKQRALQRGKEFRLTLSEFREFVAKNTDFLAKRGKEATSLSIDRIREDGPYAADNIQVLTLSQNSAKSSLWRLRKAPVHILEKYARFIGA